MLKFSKIQEIIPEKEISLLKNISNMGHEDIIYCTDTETNLKAIIAVHSTKLGPGLGGCRMWNYESNLAAINDVLRLSRGMTFKASITGLNLGGGKAVIIGDSSKDKTEKMMESFGEFVESLNGKYITAEDVGMTTSDMEMIKRKTNHVVGTPKSMGGSGDPSVVTAYGVYMGMKGSANFLWNNDNLKGKKILIQGIGNVGKNLIQYLQKEDANIYINDINKEKIEEIKKQYNVSELNDIDMFKEKIDIYSPCALGATLNNNTIPKLTCSIVAGAANNQLEQEGVHDIMLKNRNILYAPDFLINAGGLINVYSELKKFDQEKALNKTEEIYNTTISILDKSKKEDISSHSAALSIAQERLSSK